MANKLLFTSNEWDLETIDKTWKVIHKLAQDKYGLSYYKPRFEIVTYDHMLDVYASHGLPNLYRHWSFGKSFIQHEENYKQGKSGLAYEVVLNTNPTLTYLMENNTMTMQTLVMAHAVCGHGSFFKNNYMFTEHTNADTILGKLLRGKRFIEECEEKYGEDKVEMLLDSCHALALYAVDKYPRKTKDYKKIRANQMKNKKLKDSSFDLVMESARELHKKEKKSDLILSKHLNDENILRFIEKKGPKLKKWERQIIKIVREIWQYLYPQMQTQTINEGWASFWHHRIMNDLYDEGYIGENSMFEFIKSHSDVIMQPEFDSPYYSGINPYALGFAIFTDVKRICDNPTEEDKEWFPDIAGSDWLETFKFIAEQYKDNSFIQQFLSPKVIRDFKFFSLEDQGAYSGHYTVRDVHDKEGYRAIRKKLSDSKDLVYKWPDVLVEGVDTEGCRELRLKWTQFDRKRCDAGSIRKMLAHVRRLWRFPVVFSEYVDPTAEDKRMGKVVMRAD